MPRSLLRISLFLTLLLAACLTVNVYIYPSQKVDETAQKLIEDIRGEVVGETDVQGDTGDVQKKKNGDPQGWNFLGIVHAAGQETTVSNPQID